MGEQGILLAATEIVDRHTIDRVRTASEALEVERKRHRATLDRYAMKLSGS